MMNLHDEIVDLAIGRRAVSGTAIRCEEQHGVEHDALGLAVDFEVELVCLANAGVDLGRGGLG